MKALISERSSFNSILSPLLSSILVAFSETCGVVVSTKMYFDIFICNLQILRQSTLGTLNTTELIKMAIGSFAKIKAAETNPDEKVFRLK